MRKRTLCLLLAGLMTASVLSGCGDKTAGGQPGAPPGVSNTESGGDAPGSIPSEGVDPPPEEVDPLARSPQWDELQPGEIAMQYYDIFIKSGMTVGEVVDAVEGSAVYQEQPVSWSITDTYKDLDQEFTIEAPGEVYMWTSNGYEAVTERGWRAYTASMYIAYDGMNIMEIRFFINRPGDEGTTYRVRDLPVFQVTAGLMSKYSNLDSTRMFMGSIGEIRNMDRQDLENLFDTAFKDRALETMVQPGSDFYNVDSYMPFSLNGYSIWSCRDEKDPHEGFRVYSSFSINSEGKLDQEKNWILDGYASHVYECYWVPDDAG